MITEPVTDVKAFGVVVGLREGDQPPSAVPGEPGFVQRVTAIDG